MLQSFCQPSVPDYNLCQLNKYNSLGFRFRNVQNESKNGIKITFSFKMGHFDDVKTVRTLKSIKLLKGQVEKPRDVTFSLPD